MDFIKGKKGLKSDSFDNPKTVTPEQAKKSVEVFVKKMIKEQKALFKRNGIVVRMDWKFV